MPPSGGLPMSATAAPLGVTVRAPQSAQSEPHPHTGDVGSPPISHTPGFCGSPPSSQKPSFAHDSPNGLEHELVPVSYTHLTLPTKRIV